jgi:hypothetical protein
MPSRQPIAEPPDRVDLVDDEEVAVDEPWADDGDPLPEGWEDWVEEEGRFQEEQEDLDWTELESTRPAAVVGYRARASLPELGDMSIDVFCDTGRPFSRFHAPRELLEFEGRSLDLHEVEGEPAVELRICLAGREVQSLIRLENTAEEPLLVLGRDVLRLGWAVDVSRGPGEGSGSNIVS